MSNQFLTNYTDITFLEKIKDNLRHCNSFCFSVSFIKKAGLDLLIKDIEGAIGRGCKGKIITSTYQNFTDIQSLKSFFHLMSKYKNFKCHLDYESFQDSSYKTLGFHSKGYLFQFNDYCELIIGSSNITRYALTKNIEWDLLICEKLDSKLYSQIMSEFENIWLITYPLDEDLICKYTNKLNFAIERWDMDYLLFQGIYKPNFMQRRALKELNRYRAVGVSRALVIAASGSGKTYLAAFDALNFNPKRLLYIVHEGTILKKTLETFQNIFGNNISYGIYSGESKEIDADFIFATNISMCNALQLFSSNEFDYVIIDECHHATAKTYKEIISYFKPEFLLGITATPERMDNKDVFELFDKNIPYELRLRDAIINDLIVPFKYYGIRDTLVDYGLKKSEERRLIAQLANEEHCDFIAKEIQNHMPKGKLKALAFCRNITHARMMCEGMSKHYKTAYLTGRNDIGERIRAYNDLQSDNTGLEVLFTVDILNEGVDIPGVNMVLFLRPTESSTIFIQQLGRGLRKYDNKPYVTVLDFIGNSYKRSVQIAFALSSLAENFVVEKRLMASLVNNNFLALGLASIGIEINIDKLSKEEIIKYIEQENFNKIDYLKQDYFNFKKYINAEYYPKHMDYLNNDCAPDILRFMNVNIGGKKNFSYYNFLLRIEEENLPSFTETQINFINYLSELLPLVRTTEYWIVKSLLDGIHNIEKISNNLADNIYGYKEEELHHALSFIKYITENKNQIHLDVPLDDQFVEYLDDLLTYGVNRYISEYGDNTGFKPWHSYTKNQVQLKLLKNPKDIMKGTYIYEGTVYIFASIKKGDVQEHLNYNDKFLEPDLFQWECEAGLKKYKQTELINSQKAYLFIRKVKSENGLVLPFSFVGTGKMTNPRKTNNPKGTLLFDIIMETALPDYLQFDFGLTNER